MKKNFIFVANWKMNLNFDQEVVFSTTNYENFIKLSQTPNTTLLLCPSFVSLYPISQMFKETKIYVGAQNCSKHLTGSFTGQVSVESLSFLNCKCCIIGHSETRKEFNETDKDIFQKFINLIDHKISPILCVGENLGEFQEGKVFDVLTKELEGIFNKISDLNIPDYLPIYIAYEPIWTIGSNQAATNDHLETVFAWLYTYTKKTPQQINWKFLYGGGINSKNISELKKIEFLDGFLVGGTSLSFQELEKIVKL
jgi:triosephosphate isomerase (TIM)